MHTFDELNVQLMEKNLADKAMLIFSELLVKYKKDRLKAMKKTAEILKIRFRTLQQEMTRRCMLKAFELATLIQEDKKKREFKKAQEANELRVGNAYLDNLNVVYLDDRN
jgi:hypothetical protein